jgi:hypothetical protein
LRAEAGEDQALGRRLANDGLPDALESARRPLGGRGVEPADDRHLGLELQRQVPVLRAQLRDRVLEDADRLLEAPEWDARMRQLTGRLCVPTAGWRVCQRSPQALDASRVADEHLSSAELS